MAEQNVEQHRVYTVRIFGAPEVQQKSICNINHMSEILTA